MLKNVLLTLEISESRLICQEQKIQTQLLTFPFFFTHHTECLLGALFSIRSKLYDKHGQVMRMKKIIFEPPL